MIVSGRKPFFFLPALLLLGACTRSGNAPAVSIFGSFFPAWILCALAGLVVAIVGWKIFAALGLDEHLPARLLVYLSLATASSIGIWYALFGDAP